MSYEGHLPNQSPVQKHSAGDLFPVFIVVYGNGQARWVDPERRFASYGCPAARVDASARAYLRMRRRATGFLAQILRQQYEQWQYEQGQECSTPRSTAEELTAIINGWVTRPAAPLDAQYAATLRRDRILRLVGSYGACCRLMARHRDDSVYLSEKYRRLAEQRIREIEGELDVQ